MSQHQFSVPQYSASFHNTALTGFSAALQVDRHVAFFLTAHSVALRRGPKQKNSRELQAVKKRDLPVTKKTSKRAEAMMKKVDVQWQPRQTLFQRVPAQANALECCSVLLLPRAGPSQHLLARQAHNLICFIPVILSTNKPSLSFTWYLDSALPHACSSLIVNIYSNLIGVCVYVCLCLSVSVLFTASLDPTVIFRSINLHQNMAYC